MRFLPITGSVWLAYLALAFWRVAAADFPASLLSVNPVQVNGQKLSAAGVYAWPLAVGDEIATVYGEAALRFPGGAVANLAKGSRVRIIPADDHLKLKMLSGQLEYSIPTASRLEVVASDDSSQKHLPCGSFSMDSRGIIWRPGCSRLAAAAKPLPWSAPLLGAYASARPGSADK